MRIVLIDYMHAANFKSMGWYMWVYPNDPQEFIEWMNANMLNEYSAVPKTVSSSTRGTSSMVATFITSEADYALFKLKWVYS